MANLTMIKTFTAIGHQQPGKKRRQRVTDQLQNWSATRFVAADIDELVHHRANFFDQLLEHRGRNLTE